MWKKNIVFVLICFFLWSVTFIHLFHIRTYADEIDDIAHQLENLKRDLQESQNATRPLEKDLEKLTLRLNHIKSQIKAFQEQIQEKQKEVKKSEGSLVFQKNLLNTRVFALYKNAKKAETSLLDILSGENLSKTMKSLFYQKTLADQDKKTIVRIVLYIKGLEDKKRELELQTENLNNLQIEINNQSAFLATEISKAKKYQTELSQKIAQLSARQQQLIAQKLSSLNLPTSLGAGPLYCVDDRKIDPGFSPAFAFFTFGIPHRIGLNQYGALGRAKEGQSYQDILKSYYDGISFEKRDPNTRIKVQGYGEMALDDYLLGVYEMPENWPLEALKAQVVAARSYALSYTNNGEKEICTSQACQVYKGGNKGGQWEQAVRDTAGEVMVRDGAVITAWYASTFGGYAFQSSDVGWSPRPWTKRMRDTRGDVESFQDLFDKAFDKDSPCFYSAQGFRAEYNKSAWLKSEEVADIVNVLILAKTDPSTQIHLSQIDKPNPDSTDTWDSARVKQELKNRGINPFNTISNVSIEWDKIIGRTTTITFVGDSETRSFDGSEFKSFFNLRAPANIQIVGQLFNVEKR